jgi:acyl-CoA thioesterase YciA
MSSENNKELAIKVIMMPKDTNALGTIFGGVILSYIDLAGAVEARKHIKGRFVTVAMHEVKFVAPVYMGDIVSFYTKVEKIGNTSITIKVEVESERMNPFAYPPVVRVTEAEIVFVAVDENGKPMPIQKK